MNGLQVDKAEVDMFLKSCRETLGENLIAVVLYGSRYWGFADEDSDYDLFLFVKKVDKKSKRDSKELSKRYPKFHIRYFVAITDERIVRRSGWAGYVVLTEFSYPLFKTKVYSEFLKTLKKNTPDIKEVVKVYKFEKNKYEMDEFQKKTGFKANEWGFFSIWRRLQIIDFYGNSKVRTDLDENIKACSDMVSKHSSQFLHELQDRVYKRSDKWDKSDYEHSVKILKHLNTFIENIPT